MARAGLEPGTVGLQVRRADHSATLPPYLKGQPKPSQWPFVDWRVWAGVQTSADQTEGAQEYLREVMQNREIPKIQSTLSEEFVCDFVWQWNIPNASHQNGVVESLIKSVR